MTEQFDPTKDSYRFRLNPQDALEVLETVLGLDSSNNPKDIKARRRLALSGRLLNLAYETVPALRHKVRKDPRNGPDLATKISILWEYPEKMRTIAKNKPEIELAMDLLLARDDRWGRQRFLCKLQDRLSAKNPNNQSNEFLKDQY